MNFEGGHHMKVIRSIGVSLGLWPYRRTILGKMNGAIALTIVILCIVAQLAVFVTHEFSVDLFLQCMTGILPPSFFVLKYFYFILNMDQVKYIFEWIQCDYDSLTNERELRLSEKYADLGKSISNIWLYCLLLVFIPMGLPYLSVLLDIKIPGNQSRTALLPIKLEYFVDQDQYFYWIALHFDATTIVGISTLSVTESVGTHFFIHACGLLEITGDRVDRLWESRFVNVLSTKTHSSMHDQLVATIQLHQRALKFMETLSIYLQQYCIVVIIGVISLSMNLYILAKGIMLMKITTEMLTALVQVIVHFFYMGFGNYIGQHVIDKGDELFMKTYDGGWHESPLPIQKMFLYFRQKCVQPTVLVFGGLYTCSFEFFSKLVNISTSYFMIIYSTT